MDFNLNSLDDSKVWGAVHKLLRIESPKLYRSSEGSQSSGHSTFRPVDGRQQASVLSPRHAGVAKDDLQQQLNQTLLANERLLAWKDRATEQMHNMQAELAQVKELQDEISRQQADIRVLNERLRMETMQSSDFRRKAEECSKVIKEMQAAHSKDLNELNTTRAQLDSIKHQNEGLRSALEQANEAINMYENTKDMMLNFQKAKRSEFETKVKRLEEKNNQLQALLNDRTELALCDVRANLQIVSEEDEEKWEVEQTGEQTEAQTMERMVQTEIEGDSLDRCHKMQLEQLKSSHEYDMRVLRSSTDRLIEELRWQVEDLEKSVEDGKERERSMKAQVEKVNLLLDACNGDNFQLKMEVKRLQQNLELMTKELEGSLAVSRRAEKEEEGLKRARSFLLGKWEELREQVEMTRTFSEWRRREERLKSLRRCIELCCSLSSLRSHFLLFKSAIGGRRQLLDNNRRIAEGVGGGRKRATARSCLQRWREETEKSSLTSGTVKRILQSFLVRSPRESFLLWTELVALRRRTSRRVEAMEEEKRTRQLERGFQSLMATMRRRERRRMMERKAATARQTRGRELLRSSFLLLSDRARFMKDIWSTVMGRIDISSREMLRNVLGSWLSVCSPKISGVDCSSR
eukprot:754264-Hanusia_phi.AAC.2